jgi:hypothetical protein
LYVFSVGLRLTIRRKSGLASSDAIGTGSLCGAESTGAALPTSAMSRMPIRE